MAIYLGFDFGYKRIGTAIGQSITGNARPLVTLRAEQGIPQWKEIKLLIQEWQPQALIVGFPTCINDKALYTTKAAKKFAQQLSEQFQLPVHLVDERLSTVEARAQIFAAGGYKKLKKTPIDNIAACIIVEQWLSELSE